MADHKISDFVTKKSCHAVTLVSKYTVKATSDTLSVDPLVLFEQLITVVYKCVTVWAMCSSPNTIWGYWHHVTTQQSISSKCHTGMSTTFKYSKPSRCQLPLKWRCSDPQNSANTGPSLCGKYTEYVKKEIWPKNVLFDGYPDGSSINDNSHLRCKKSSGSNFSYLQETTQVHCL